MSRFIKGSVGTMAVFAFVFIGAPTTWAQTMRTEVSGNVDVPPRSATEDADVQDEGVYSKRVGGLVWLEGTAGASRFNVTRFRTLDIIPDAIAAQIPSIVVSGPEFGAALKFRAGSATMGLHFKKANYDPFDLITAGLDFGFMIRAVPYVHPTIRFGLNYHTTTGAVLPDLGGLVRDLRTNGAGASIGLGLRIPLVKWVSLSADFDYSIIGLVVRGTEALGGASLSAGTAGSAISGSVALTVHLGG